MKSHTDLDACNRLFFQHFEFSLFYPCKGVSGNKNAVDLTSVDSIENDLKQLSENIVKLSKVELTFYYTNRIVNLTKLSIIRKVELAKEQTLWT